MQQTDTPTDGGPPRVGKVLETSLYVDDLERSGAFYVRVLGFLPASEPSPRLLALEVTGDQVLLLFKKKESEEPVDTPYGTIPAHGGEGVLHVAFSILPTAFEVWRDWLGRCEIPIESIVEWPTGGRSLYFRDPDGHSVELKSSNWSGRELDEASLGVARKGRGAGS